MSALSTTTDFATIRRLYQTMSRIRHFEESAARLMANGKLAGQLHVSIGQEAVAAGVCDVLRSYDYITTTHRGHGHCIAKGGRIDAMMSELFGREGGYCGGRSGSMHIADPDVGILGANAIVGAGIPIAAGGAFASKARGDGVSVAFFGEGAVAQGVFHESLNLAALWQLPIVFVCENNLYAELTPASMHIAAERVADFGAPHRIPGMQVDGNDVLAVRAAADNAVYRARGGDGPTLLECMTYRWHGHFEGDPQRYRDTEEVQSWRTADPLERLKGVVSDQESADGLREIEEESQQEVADAVRVAEQGDNPSLTSISDYVYRDPSTEVRQG